MKHYFLVPESREVQWQQLTDVFSYEEQLHLLDGIRALYSKNPDLTFTQTRSSSTLVGSLVGWATVFGDGCCLQKMDVALLPKNEGDARELLAALIGATKAPRPPTAAEAAHAAGGDVAQVAPHASSSSSTSPAPAAATGPRADAPVAMVDDSTPPPPPPPTATPPPPPPSDPWAWQTALSPGPPSATSETRVLVHANPSLSEAIAAVLGHGAEVWIVVPTAEVKRDAYRISSIESFNTFKEGTTYHEGEQTWQYRKKLARAVMRATEAVCGADDSGKQAAAEAAAAATHLARRRPIEDNAVYQAGVQDARDAMQQHMDKKVPALTKGIGISYSVYGKLRKVLSLETRAEAVKRAITVKPRRSVPAPLRGEGAAVVAAVESCAADDTVIQAAAGSNDFITDCSDRGIFRKAGQLLIANGASLTDNSHLGQDMKAAYFEAKGLRRPAAVVRAKPVALSVVCKRDGKKDLVAQFSMPSLPTVDSARQTIKGNRVGVLESASMPVLTPRKLCAAMPIPSFITERGDDVNALVLRHFSSLSKVTPSELASPDMEAAVASSGLPAALPQVDGGLLVDLVRRQYMRGVTGIGGSSTVGSLIGMHADDVTAMGFTAEVMGEMKCGGGYFYTDAQVAEMALKRRYYVGNPLPYELSGGVVGELTFRDPRAVMLYHLQTIAFQGGFIEPPEGEGANAVTVLVEHEWTDGSTVARKPVMVLALCFIYNADLCRPAHRRAFQRPFVMVAAQNAKETKEMHGLLTQLYTAARQLRFPKGEGRLLKVTLLRVVVAVVRCCCCCCCCPLGSLFVFYVFFASHARTHARTNTHHTPHTALAFKFKWTSKLF